MNLENIIEIKKGQIQDAPVQYSVDAIVNCAKPTLMGSNSNVDGAIHTAIDNINGSTGFFKEKIKAKFADLLKTDREDILRCSRGKAVITEGYGLCEYVIHAVGPVSDRDYSRSNGAYSSSCVEKLTECYQSIMKLVFEYPGIEKIGIPVISSGNYGFDFEYAFVIGLTAVYNALLEKKKEEGELFEYIGLKKVYFIIPDQQNYNIAQDVYRRYEKTFQKEHRAVSRGVCESQKEFWREIYLYDNKKGYFTIAKIVRQILLFLRMHVLGIWTCIKDRVSKEDWVIRRETVEITSFIKMVLPVLLMWIVMSIHPCSFINIIFMVIIIYDLLDTVTYLLTLMFLSDIQRPSANVSRSLIMLVVNYIEVRLDITCIWMIICKLIKVPITVKTIFEYIISNSKTTFQWLNWINNGIKFFFLTFVLSYFCSHMRQRKFRTY